MFMGCRQPLLTQPLHRLATKTALKSELQTPA
jgi:hypothetical protein